MPRLDGRTLAFAKFAKGCVKAMVPVCQGMGSQVRVQLSALKINFDGTGGGRRFQCRVISLCLRV
jgi:hypothetical protein